MSTTKGIGIERASKIEVGLLAGERGLCVFSVFACLFVLRLKSEGELDNFVSNGTTTKGPHISGSSSKI